MLFRPVPASEFEFPSAESGLPRGTIYAVKASMVTPVFQDVARPAHIVVAEDDFEMRRLVTDCLRKEGYDVQEVSDGDQLLLRVEDRLFLSRASLPIDLFVTDIRMPAYTGLEIVSGLRDAGLTTPVIIMTAFGNAETRERAEALGAKLLDKPFKMAALLALVRQQLQPKVKAELDRRTP